MILKQLEGINHALKKMQTALNNQVSVYENTLRDVINLKVHVEQLETAVDKLTGGTNENP
jgi:conjugal transfer/entry exclusion protein